jgi:predicted transcriptional regulator
MDNEQQLETSELLTLTSEIVASHVSNNTVAVTDLPNLIAQVYGALHNLSGPPEPPKEELRPAVPIKKSVTDDYIVCLEDGKKMKMLKRHLSTAYGMTPEQYREKWGLTADYPMVAPSYSLKRQRLAKENGLGRNRAAE